LNVSKKLRPGLVKGDVTREPWSTATPNGVAGLPVPPTVNV
jgi:hypothetical protein